MVANCVLVVAKMSFISQLSFKSFDSCPSNCAAQDALGSCIHCKVLSLDRVKEKGQYT